MSDDVQTTDVVTKRRSGPLTDEHHVGEDTWTIEAHDDQPIAEGNVHATDLRVLLLLNGERVREFAYPSYRIWTLLAHWTDGLNELDQRDLPPAKPRTTEGDA